MLLMPNTSHSESLWNCNIPQKSYKTVPDAYNGYHQVPIDEDSINLTIFITEFGR